MSNQSLRTAIELFGPNPSFSLRSLRNEFWNVYEKFAKTLEPKPSMPFNSLRETMDNLTWFPNATGEEGGLGGGYDNPKDLTAKWTWKLQGITHDEDFWYFSSEDDEATIANIGEEGALFKIPKTLPLRDIDRGAVTHVSYPPELARGAGSYHHIGDIDFVDSWNLIVGAVESNSGAPPVVALFDRDLAFRGKARLDHQHEAPWCAVEPRTKLLVSSVFNYSDAGPIELQFYALDRPSPATVEATWVGNMVLRDRDGAELKAKGVQGAAFSKRGHLYLAVQEQINRSDGALWPAGIRAFDMLTGRLVLWHNIDFKPGPEELEGLTLWDADKEYVGIVGGVEVDTGNRPHVPHGVHGQIHVIMSRNGTSLYFKHYGIIKGSADDL